MTVKLDISKARKVLLPVPTVAEFREIIAKYWVGKETSFVMYHEYFLSMGKIKQMEADDSISRFNPKAVAAVIVPDTCVGISLLDGGTVVGCEKNNTFRIELDYDEQCNMKSAALKFASEHAAEAIHAKKAFIKNNPFAAVKDVTPEEALVLLKQD